MKTKQQQIGYKKALKVLVRATGWNFAEVVDNCGNATLQAFAGCNEALQIVVRWNAEHTYKFVEREQLNAAIRYWRAI